MCLQKGFGTKFKLGPQYNEGGVLDRKYDGQVLEELLKPTYNVTHKLDSEESTVTARPEPTFLASLGQIMGRKMAGPSVAAPQVADGDEEYVKDESGKWVSRSQLEAKRRLDELNRDLRDNTEEGTKED